MQYKLCAKLCLAFLDLVLARGIGWGSGKFGGRDVWTFRLGVESTKIVGHSVCKLSVRQRASDAF